jgi:hypothetical protein
MVDGVTQSESTAVVQAFSNHARKATITINYQGDIYGCATRVEDYA